MGGAERSGTEPAAGAATAQRGCSADAEAVVADHRVAAWGGEPPGDVRPEARSEQRLSGTVPADQHGRPGNAAVRTAATAGEAGRQVHAVAIPVAYGVLSR